MNRLNSLCVLSLLFCACQVNDDQSATTGASQHNVVLSMVSDIPLPTGYTRVDTSIHSFGNWLREIPLRKDDHVYLYNGELKRNQSAQFAVLDISVGKKNLQQCADAVMRLRAEYLFALKRYAEIEFSDNAGKTYKWAGGHDRQTFDRYLENVFGWCGSASLEKQLRLVADVKNIQPGDVFIKGGFPGHAMIVMDVAENDKGHKLFMLAQSYMPAQDIHIVRNPLKDGKSPWYAIDEIKNEITTPEWTFYTHQLRRW